MSENLNIQFSVSGKNYNINLKEGGVSSCNKVNIAGVEYSLLGSKEEIEFARKFIEQIHVESGANLTEIGKEIKARLWSAGAEGINLSTLKGTHKIGINSLSDSVPLDVHKTVENICKTMEENYVFPDLAKKCTQFLQQQLKERAYDAISDLGALAQVITADLRSITEDKHIEVMVAFKRHEIEPKTEEKIESIIDSVNVDNIEEPVMDDFSRPNLINIVEYKASSDIGLMGRSVENLSYEIQTGFVAEDPTIGYMDLNVFGVCKERDDSLEMKKDVDNRRQAFINAVDSLKETDTIIIDLRNNGGGDPFAVQLLCSLFIDEGIPLNRIEYRSGEDQKTEEFNTLSYKELPKEKRLLDKEVYILLGPFTFSAAEEFSNDMKVSGRATFVGEPSGGGANPGRPFPISDDLEIFIPTGRAVNPIEEGNWEGLGIFPDHIVPEARAYDQVIELIKDKKNL